MTSSAIGSTFLHVCMQLLVDIQCTSHAPAQLQCSKAQPAKTAQATSLHTLQSHVNVSEHLRLTCGHAVWYPVLQVECLLNCCQAADCRHKSLKLSTQQKICQRQLVCAQHSSKLTRQAGCWRLHRTSTCSQASNCCIHKYCE